MYDPCMLLRCAGVDDYSQTGPAVVPSCGQDPGCCNILCLPNSFATSVSVSSGFYCSFGTQTVRRDDEDGLQVLMREFMHRTVRDGFDNTVRHMD